MGYLIRQEEARNVPALAASQVAERQGMRGGSQEADHPVLSKALHEVGMHHMHQMDQYSLRADLRIAAGGHLDVMMMKRFEGIFPDADHDASPVPPRCLDITGLVVIPPFLSILLVAVMPVGAVILRCQHTAIRQVEDHVEVELPSSDGDAHVATTVTDHVLEQRENLALASGGCSAAGQRAMALLASSLVAAGSTGPPGAHARTITRASDILLAEPGAGLRQVSKRSLPP